MAPSFPDGPRLVARERLHLLLLCVFAGILLFAFRSLEISGMSSGAASDTVGGKWYFFAHHLFYQPMVKIFAAALAPAGCAVVCAGQVHTILWSVLAIASVYVIIRTLGGTILAAAAAAILLLVTNGFWIYSTQLEVYVPVVALNALMAAILFARDGQPLQGGRFAAVTALFTFSLFLHQANVFFLIPIGIYLIFTQGRAGFWTAVRMTAIGGVVALATNMIIFWLTQTGSDWRDFVLWLNYYGVISDDLHGSWDTIFVDAVRARGAIRSVVIAIAASPEGALQMPVRLLVMALLLGVIVWNVVQVVKRGPHADARLFLLLWAATFFAFFWWWQPYPWKFFLTAVAPLMVLSALTAVDIARAVPFRHAPRWLAPAMGIAGVATLAALNLSNSILPLTKVSGVREFSGRLAQATPAECMIYSERRFTSVLNVYHQRQSRPFELMFQKYHYSRVDPDVADAIPTSLDLKSDQCVVIPLFWLTEIDYSGSEKNNRGTRKVAGATQTAAETPSWEEFLAWILDVQPVAGSSQITRDRMVIFNDAGGDPFVRIDRTQRETSESMQATMREISGAFEQSGGVRLGGEKYEELARFMIKSFSYF